MSVARFAVVALFACSGVSEPRRYHLVVSTDFDADQSSAIFDAALEWQQRSGGFVSFDGDPATFDAIRVDRSSATELTLEFGGGTIGLEQPQGRSAHIRIMDGLDARTFHQTALHELGHALGLVHMTPGNIMCADTVCATLDVRCGDLAQLVGRDVAGCIP